MKKCSKLCLLGLLNLFVLFRVSAQQEYRVIPKSQDLVPIVSFQRPDLSAIVKENEVRDQMGLMYRMAVGIDVNINTENSGIWSTNGQGDKIWRLKVKYPGAQALSFYFSKFLLFDNSFITVYDLAGNQLHQTYTSADVQDHGMQSLAMCEGDVMMLELVEPKGSRSSVLQMEQIAYAYRGVKKSMAKDFRDSESCQVNVNCSEGNDWQDEKKGVARILVKSGNSYGYCTGSLVNNLRRDCKPYFLTAMHCAEGTSTSDYNQWKFYFRYEATSCTTPTSQGSLANNVITGCFKLAESNDVNGNTISKSDFLLLQLGTSTNMNTIISTLKNSNFQAYWNGWDANNTTSNEGVGIHHPSGDLKKISKYTANLTSTSYSGITSNTHWQVRWVQTANGHGVTEGGSSGSPLFRYNGGNSRIMGTLSGGSSECSSRNSPDVYGKMSYHWTSVGTTSDKQLKAWLDPDNTGTLVMDGSSDPCATSTTPVAPVAEFIADQTNVSPNTTVSFSDQSTNSPTSWSWSVTPNSGFTYAAGTSSTSQNPRITFTAVGTYTVALTATNSVGSNTKTRTSYIVVSNPTGPCTATSTVCDEYISSVKLGSINNSTNCSNYTDYSSMSTTLAKGQTYTATIGLGTVQQGVNTGYSSDQIAIYIDYNNDMDFEDAGERVGYTTFSTNYTGQFTFTVPTSAVTGTVRMRVRVHYPEAGFTNILPCGTSTYGGEVEDYRINIVGGTAGIEEALTDAISIFPNPAFNQLNMLFNTTFQSADISIVDLTGKAVVKEQFFNVDGLNLDISHLQAGLYQVVIDTEYGKIVKKITKK